MARSSFIGSKLASCLNASHSLYWSKQERSGAGSRRGLKGPFILTQTLTYWMKKEKVFNVNVKYVLLLKLYILTSTTAVSFSVCFIFLSLI